MIQTILNVDNQLPNFDLQWGGLAKWAVVLEAVGGSSALDCDNSLAWTSASVVASTASSSTSSSSIFGILSLSWDEIVLNLRGIKLGRPLIAEIMREKCKFFSF